MTGSSVQGSLNEDGSNVPGWPFTFPDEAAGSVAIGDVDDDGAPEIVCHTRGGQLYLLKKLSSFMMKIQLTLLIEQQTHLNLETKIKSLLSW